MLVVGQRIKSVYFISYIPDSATVTEKLSKKFTKGKGKKKDKPKGKVVRLSFYPHSICHIIFNNVIFI